MSALPGVERTSAGIGCTFVGESVDVKCCGSSGTGAVLLSIRLERYDGVSLSVDNAAMSDISWRGVTLKAGDVNDTFCWELFQFGCNVDWDFAAQSVVSLTDEAFWVSLGHDFMEKMIPHGKVV